MTIAATRARIGWPHPPFEVPPELAARWDARPAGARAVQAWEQRLRAYRQAHPTLAAELARRLRGELPAGSHDRLTALIERLAAEGQAVATRQASQQVLAALATWLPELLGGSADLTGSNLTRVPGGRHLSYGVREFGMAAVMNGLALHGGFIPYGGTFLTFSDYSRNAVRMAALMRQRVVHVFTHDSIGLGEDGPTHQPVKHAASLRLIPGLEVWRPCDAAETATAWAAALQAAERPSALPRIGVEAGVSRFWAADGCVAALGIDRFGESAPAAQLMRHFGFTADALAQKVRQYLDAAP